MMNARTKSFSLLLFALCILVPSVHVRADLVISQYVETNSGTTPKGIELWNTGTMAIDFSMTALDISKGTNGGTPSTDFFLSTGTLAAGAVMVVGTSDMSTYLADEGLLGTVAFYTEPFTFNGDDSLVVSLGGTTQDVFGTPGTDPGNRWESSGGDIQTRNSNIALKEGITLGDTDGWSDPSERFELVSSNPVGTGGLSGFGIAPVIAAVPEPSAFLFGSLIAGSFGMVIARRNARRRDDVGTVED